MGVEIRQSELRNDNAAVMRRVGEGESFVITVNGRPVADVVPHRPVSGRRRFVPVPELAGNPMADARTWLQDLAAGDDTFGRDDPIDPSEQAPR